MRSFWNYLVWYVPFIYLFVTCLLSWLVDLQCTNTSGHFLHPIPIINLNKINNSEIIFLLLKGRCYMQLMLDSDIPTDGFVQNDIGGFIQSILWLLCQENVFSKLYRILKIHFRILFFKLKWHLTWLKLSYLTHLMSFDWLFVISSFDWLLVISNLIIIIIIF